MGNVAVSIKPSSSAPPGALGSAWDLGPDGTTLAAPAGLMISFANVQLGGTPVDMLEIGTPVDGTWQPNPSSVVDPIDQTVTVAIDRLSTWAIIPAAKTPCTCHSSDWSICCNQVGGSASVSGSSCECTGYDGHFDELNACYAARVGGERVTNFCSSCLAKCCMSNGGTVNSACDCETDAVVSVLADMCSFACFSHKDQATICLENPPLRGAPPPIGGVPNDASVADGTGAP
jgi:hypothetical protein